MAIIPFPTIHTHRPEVAEQPEPDRESLAIHLLEQRAYLASMRAQHEAAGRRLDALDRDLDDLEAYILLGPGPDGPDGGCHVEEEEEDISALAV